MKIGIDIRSTLKPAQRTGIGQYTINLVNAFAEVNSQDRFYLYSRKNPFNRRKRLPRLPAKNFAHKVDYFKCNLDKIIGKVDVFHTSDYRFLKPRHGKIIVTIHGLSTKSSPEEHTRETVDKLNKELEDMHTRVDALIAVSNFVKEIIIKYLDFPEEKIFPIYPGLNKNFHLLESNQTRSYLTKYNLPEKFILSVGVLEPHKNYESLIKGFALLKKRYKIAHKLVIVGKKGWKYEKIFSLVKSLDLKQDIIFTGYISNRELPFIYNLSNAFVCPWLYGGFNFPMIEAFGCGVPVITSNTSACAEIAQDAALQVDPYDIEKLAENTFKVLDNEELRQSLKRKSLCRAKDFSWQKCAQDTLNIFKKIARD